MAKTLFPDAQRGVSFTFDPEDLVIVEDPKHHLYDPRIHLPVDDGLVEDIMLNGVIEPVVIVREDGKPLVVDGRQRVRAAVEANKRLKAQKMESVKVVAIHRPGDPGMLLGISVSANEHRQDDSPLGRAKKAARLLAAGRSEDEIAVRFGIKKPTLRQWLSLLELAAPVQHAVDECKLSASAALQLHALPVEEQKAKLRDLLEATPAPTNGARPRQASVRQARKVSKTARAQIAVSLPEVQELCEKIATLDNLSKYQRGLLAALRWCMGGAKPKVQGE